jgi:hypothetical protein
MKGQQLQISGEIFGHCLSGMKDFLYKRYCICNSEVLT